jgi:hypothetical protein
MARSRRKPNKPDVVELVDRLAAEEERFLAREFLAPAVGGGEVRVRIGGVVCRVRTQPVDFEGIGVFRPVSHTRARLVRPASLAERRAYLDLFPAVRLVVCLREGAKWFGSAASFGDRRVRIEGLVPIELAEEVQTFDVATARFDGAAFWFDQLDPRHDPGAAAYLRRALDESVPPEDLDRPRLTAEERAAYELNYWQLVRPPDEEPEDQAPRRNPPHRRRSRRGEAEPPPATDADPVRRRLRENLSHAGARLVDYLERADSYRVTYTIGGRQHTSSVDKGDLTVHVAGICLSGEDRKFDLASLVGVLREGDQDDMIYPVGDGNYGIDEEEYWRIHPPRSP